jgi:ABC-type transporter MlaC component
MASQDGSREWAWLRRRRVILGAIASIQWRSEAAPAQPAPAMPAANSPVSPMGPITILRSGLLALASGEWPPQAVALFPLVAETFDLSGITRSVLGSAASSLTPDQATRFAQVFGQRMVRELMRHRPDPEKDRFAILETRPIGPAEWLVITSHELPAGTAGGPVVLSWRVRALPEGPRIVDLSRDGISAIQVQRNDIAIALRTRSLEKLLTDIESRAAW